MTTPTNHRAASAACRSALVDFTATIRQLVLAGLVTTPRRVPLRRRAPGYWLLNVSVDAKTRRSAVRLAREVDRVADVLRIISSLAPSAPSRRLRPRTSLRSRNASI